MRKRRWLRPGRKPLLRARYVAASLALVVSMAARGQAPDQSLPPAEGANARSDDSTSSDAVPSAPGVGPTDPEDAVVRDVLDEETLRSLSDEQRFRRAQNQFEYGDCESVVDVLAEFTLGGTSKRESQIVDAHRMLGICYFQLGRRSESVRELKSLLYVDPDHELDPFLTPPPVMELFDEIRAEMKARLEEVRRARAEVRDLNPTAGILVERERVVRRVPIQVVLLPFGLAQLANGEPVKAVAVGIGQGALLALNGLFFWTGAVLDTKVRLLGIGNPFEAPLASIDVEQRALLRTSLWWLHAGALGLLLVSYGVGTAEALWSLDEEQDEGVTERRLDLKTGAVLPEPSATAP